MDLILAFELMMLLTSSCAALMSGWLWWHSRYQRTLAGLAGFGAMMALWCLGHVFVIHDQPELGRYLLLANPLMPTFFLHFALRFVRQDQVKASWLSWSLHHIGWLYFLTALVVLLSWSLDAGEVLQSVALGQVFVFHSYGFLNLLYTVLLGILAHAVLWYGWRHHQGNKKRSIVAMFLAGGWGLLLATSVVFPSFGLDWFPYPMLLLPSYPVLLVYGVVRYQMLTVNALANRALLWLVMSLLLLLLMALVSSIFGQLGMKALANVPGWQLWLYSSLVLLLTAACYRPVAKLAERLIYPGATLDQSLINTWRQQLAQCQNWTSLSDKATELLSEALKQKVQVQLSASGAVMDANAQLRVRCYSQQGQWQVELLGWDDMTPGIRLVAQVFGSLLSSSCELLAQSLQLAEAEKQQLSQQHLVEMGALAASMAHELRNPLNIISMASAGVDAELRAHIQQQLKRADRLISDMLVYSGRLQLQYSDIEFEPLLQSLLQQFDWQQVKLELKVPQGLTLQADPHRLQQVFLNLFDNANAFLRNQADASLSVQVTEDHHQIRVLVHNNGPALDASLTTEQLFRPFISKRSGGSGLGLAIVKRIMDAHRGQISFRTDLGWVVSFELLFPKDSTDV
ncbi:sensor histidine kinase [Rheinheimera sp.]|uniref:sensor histidine kinase n=1 Tax=Rheinheimera sp. TaxID=1869214 RepID=UPI0026148F54|nr:sensor histidine kinase [Rheinheimera sp.]MCA1930407.1 GHKL domain-containing protein [Rheinheimera sp.]